MSETADTLAQMEKPWRTLDENGRNAHLKWVLDHCTFCGGETTTKGSWCDGCLETEAAMHELWLQQQKRNTNILQVIDGGLMK